MQPQHTESDALGRVLVVDDDRALAKTLARVLATERLDVEVAHDGAQALALLRNEGLKYVCKPVELDVTNSQTRFTAGYKDRRRVAMTVGNGEGNFFADDATLERLEGEGQVVFRYVDNPNGSSRSIAGIVNARGNVLGLMPHPDRAFEPELGSADGALLFQSALASA